MHSIYAWGRYNSESFLEEDMKTLLFPMLLKIFAKSILVLTIVSSILVPGQVRASNTETISSQGSCGALLAEAEARFLDTLAPDGSVPASPQTEAAAQEYIRVSKLCYEELEAQNLAGDSSGETPTFIDDGAIIMESELSAEFVAYGHKWGAGTMGTAGGTVTYSFMGSGLNLSQEPNSSNFGSSVAISSLPGFQACFITEIMNAFAAWQAVSNIQFVQVSDSVSAFNASGASGDIRIGAHTFDGASGTLAHAYYPPPNGVSGAGDMHFDREENWTCNTSGIDIGIVAIHEIGHSLGLEHENTSVTAMMDPVYNRNLTGLQSDDVNGATAIYGGPAALLAAPANDDFANAKTVASVPYMDTIDTTGAQEPSDNLAASVSCEGRSLRTGTKNVWYRYTSPTTRSVSFDTLGSNYDTYIAVWTGSDVNSLSLVTCDDDTNEGLQSRLTFTAQAGVQYKIEVAQYNGVIGGSTSPTSGGTLKFHATTFADVASNYWAWRWIEGLSSAGVTAGCTTIPRNYCPGTLITRDQMAVFLLRAKHGSSYSPPLPSGVFQDVPTNHWAAAWIERLAAEGITSGCNASPPQYCPATPVTRDQMAVFIARTFNISPLP